MVVEVVIVLFVGLFIGSFLNVVIYRVPLGISVINPRRSFCRGCGVSLKWYHNIPIVSWVVLRGKSHCCKEAISVQYPLVEGFSAVIFLSVYFLEGITIQASVLVTAFTLFFALSVIDYFHHAIPDSLSLSVLSISIFYGDIATSLQGALLFMGTMSALRFYVSYLLKKEAMGEGDIIIGGAMGAILGVKFAFIAIFIAACLALPIALYLRYIKKTDAVLPFVPFLFAGTVAALLYLRY